MALESRTWKVLWSIPLLTATIYSAFVGWFVFKQDSIAFAPRKGLRNAESLQLGIERVLLMTSDNITLVGWVIPSARAESSGVWFLYLHGNGGNISSRTYVSHYRVFRRLGINTFAIDYRGYGESEGAPSEEGLYADAMAAFNYLKSERHIPSDKIFIFGYSLGSAVGIELAKNVVAGGLILQGALTSAADVAHDWYPFLPAQFLMKYKFNSIGAIEDVTEPKLFVHATNDGIIPFHHGRELFERAREPKTFIETGGDHNDAQVVDSTTFYGGLTKFLKEAER